MITQGKSKLVAIVEDDDLMRSAMGGLLKAVGLPAQEFASAEEFLNSGVAGPNGAAARLGIPRSTLYFRMQKLGISRSA